MNNFIPFSEFQKAIRWHINPADQATVVCRYLASITGQFNLAIFIQSRFCDDWQLLMHSHKAMTSGNEAIDEEKQHLLSEFICQCGDHIAAETETVVGTCEELSKRYDKTITWMDGNVLMLATGRDKESDTNCIVCVYANETHHFQNQMRKILQDVANEFAQGIRRCYTIHNRIKPPNEWDLPGDEPVKST